MHAQATLDAQKREADTDAADQKGRLLNKTLGKMNRVLGISQGMSEVEIVELESHRMSRVTKLITELESRLMPFDGAHRRARISPPDC